MFVIVTPGAIGTENEPPARFEFMFATAYS
jgi:hypothetical protein